MTVRTFVDPLGPVKAWIASVSVAGVGSRVYIGDPERATMPYIALTLVDGQIDAGEAPIAYPRVQCTVQAATELDAATAVWSLLTAAESLTPGTQLGGTLRCVGARRELGPIARIDETGPRYIVDLVFAVIA